ncbi:MAG: hypothetical protein ACK6AD_14050 [Cyanobacteriota bacterium]
MPDLAGWLRLNSASLRFSTADRATLCWRLQKRIGRDMVVIWEGGTINTISLGISIVKQKSFIFPAQSLVTTDFLAWAKISLGLFCRTLLRCMSCTTCRQRGEDGDDRWFFLKMEK